MMTQVMTTTTTACVFESMSSLRSELHKTTATVVVCRRWAVVCSASSGLLRSSLAQSVAVEMRLAATMPAPADDGGTTEEAATVG